MEKVVADDFKKFDRVANYFSNQFKEEQNNLFLLRGINKSASSCATVRIE